MNEQEVSGGFGPVAGAAAVSAEWRRIERERIEAEQAEAAADEDPEARTGRQRLLWPALLAALAAGVVAAGLASVAFQPSGPVDDDLSGVGRPLGLLARPETTPGSLPIPDEPSDAAEATPPDAVDADHVEVFVPVPTTAVGPPRSDEVLP